MSTTGEDLTSAQVAEITAYTDIEASPPGQPVALIVFGTNQQQPASIAADRYHRGLAPLIIVTGGVNRHDGIIEGQVFRELLNGRGVPPEVIRVEDQAANTWQNVEYSLPWLREALSAGLRLAAVSKWYHRRAVVAKISARQIAPVSVPDPDLPGRYVRERSPVPAARRRGRLGKTRGELR